MVCVVFSRPAAADAAPDDRIASPVEGPADLELAKAHFNTGQIYYERGRFPDAAREFEEAYRLSSKPELLYNMGKSYDGAGDAARALRAYRRFLFSVTTSPDRPTVEARVEQLAKIVGRLAITSTVSGSTVKVDGLEVGTTPLEAPLEVNPGAHHVEVGHEGYATWKGDVVSVPGQELPVAAAPQSLVKIVRVEVPAEKPVPVYKKWWLWTAVAAVAVVAVGVTAGVVTTSSSSNGVNGPYAQLPAVR